MNDIHKLMHRLHNPDLAALFIRIALGIVFINAGWMKISNMAATVGFFGSFGFPSPLAYVVSYAELLCGIAFILGFFVRYAGILISIIMVVAAKLVFAKGFSLANGGFEYNFVLMFCALAMVTLGAGTYSLAYMLKKNKQ